jgi:paraquat-inducible protein A
LICTRCGAVLRRFGKGTPDLPLAFALAALVFFALANAFPLLALRLHGVVQETTIPGCARILASMGWPWLAAVVVTTVEIAPLAHLAGLVYVLLKVKRKRATFLTAKVFRWTQDLPAWGMAEVFVLGILISYVKLSKMAEVLPGPSLYALGAFVLASAAAYATLDADTVWDAVEDS